MDIRKNSWHYRWIEWLYGFWDGNVSTNLCAYFWQIVLTILLAPFTLITCIISCFLMFAFALLSWIMGTRCTIKPPQTKNSENYGCRPCFFITDQGPYKLGLYSKNQNTYSRIAPWEILLLSLIVYGLITSTAFILYILAILSCILLFSFLTVKKWDVFTEYVDSVKKKRCKKLNFID